MADLTHADLMQMTERLEDSFRREVDRVSTQLERQTVRADEDRAVISKHSEDIRVLQHDVRTITNVQQGRAALQQAVEAPPALPALTPAQRKAFIGGIVAAVMMLAGIAQGASEVIAELLKRLKP